MRFILRYRRLFVVMLHLVLVVLANAAAFWLRFDGDVPSEERLLFVQMLPLLLAIRGVAFVPFHLYHGLWRYTSIWDLRNILGSVACSSVAFYAAVHLGFGITRYPRSVFLIDAMLLVCLIGGVRLTRRLYRDIARFDAKKRILIFGAGDAGEMVVRDMKNNSFYDYRPIGFIDDNRGKVRHRIHGVPVLGTREALPQIIAKERPDEVLVAMPKADLATIRGVVKALEPFKLPITTLPSFRDLIDGRISVNAIRNLSIEDLLERTPVGLDSALLLKLVEGKRVVVTGAAGSIGSELCRQVASLKPSALILYERYENGLYTIVKELSPRQKLVIQPVIGDVADEHRVRATLAEVGADIVFHAAAHKHVPLMELNPCEAVKNNVTGTRVVAEAAAACGVERFILISTDKAVNPSSVMGATKRVAEILVERMSRCSSTCFLAVRFGNVLGSNGSVVPLFLEQIRSGGPVTVTHPDVRRYFMLTSEAVQLVLHAAAIGESGIYILEMGEQVRIVDMARSLIRLSGFVPEEEIQISYVGLRPGEKMFEELIGQDEKVEPSQVDKIMRVVPGSEGDSLFEKYLASLESAAVEGDVPAALGHLVEIVPNFQRSAVSR